MGFDNNGWRDWSVGIRTSRAAFRQINHTLSLSVRVYTPLTSPPLTPFNNSQNVSIIGSLPRLRSILRTPSPIVLPLQGLTIQGAMGCTSAIVFTCTFLTSLSIALR